MKFRYTENCNLDSLSLTGHIYWKRILSKKSKEIVFRPQMSFCLYRILLTGLIWFYFSHLKPVNLFILMLYNILSNVPVMEKPINWFAEQTNWLVSMRWEHCCRILVDDEGKENIGSRWTTSNHRVFYKIAALIL